MTGQGATMSTPIFDQLLREMSEAAAPITAEVDVERVVEDDTEEHALQCRTG